MNQKEFYYFLQKQRDFEDESKQLEQSDLREAGKKMLKLISHEAGKKNMTLEEFVNWVENQPKGKGYAKLIETFKDWSK